LLLSEEEDIRVDVNKSYPEEKHKTLLHLASERGEAEAVRLLVSSGADSNIR
jgi:ankyrin repeat protein